MGQDQRIKGQGNAGLMAAGDIIFGDKYHLQAGDFQEFSLSQAAPPEFEPPAGASELVAVLQLERLLIVGGTKLQDKLELAQHLAWQLKVKLEQQSNHESSTPVGVAEALGLPGRAALETELHRVSYVRVLIAGDCGPHHVGEDLEKLQGTLVRARRYLLITTDKARREWGPLTHDLTNRVWREPEAAKLYSKAYLADLLAERLNAAPQPLPRGLLPDRFALQTPAVGETALVKGLGLSDAVSGFSTRSQVMNLAGWLLSLEEAPDRAGVLHRAQQIATQENAVGSWFRRLSERHQLLAVGCLLFDRLFTDQLLSALDVVVQSLWRSRKPSQTCFDYQDLDVLEAYFRRRLVPGHGELLVLSVEARGQLLDAVWGLQRRQLLVVLPLISDLIRAAGVREKNFGTKFGGLLRSLMPSAASDETESLERSPDVTTSGSRANSTGMGAVDATSPAEDEVVVSRHLPYGLSRDLFGSSEHALRFCKEVGRTLGYLSQHHFPEVERCLFELASHESHTAQHVAALALGSWSEIEHENRMVEILNRWYGGPTEDEKRIARNEASLRQKAQANVRSTVALAVMRAAERVREGHLPQLLLDILSRLERDSSSDVRQQLCRQTIPALVAWHQRQADPLLRRLVVKPDFRVGIAQAWASALNWNPEPAATILEEWFQGGVSEAARGGRSGRRGTIEAQLATVALCLGLVNYSEEGCPVPLAKAVGRLSYLLRWSDSALLSEVLTAIGCLIRENFDQLHGHLQPLVEIVPVSWRQPIVDALHDVYLDQRRLLPGGETLFVFQDRTYPTWLRTSRPLTVLEELLEVWVRDPGTPAAQQVSFETLAWLTNCDFSQEERRAQLEALRVNPSSTATPVSAPATSGTTTTKAPDSVRRLGPISKGVLSFLSWGQTELTGVASHLAAEIVADSRLQGRRLEALLSVWKRRTQFNSLGELLFRFATWYRYRFQIGCLAVLGLFIFGLYLLALAASSSLSN